MTMLSSVVAEKRKYSLENSDAVGDYLRICSQNITDVMCNLRGKMFAFSHLADASALLVLSRLKALACS